MIGVLGGGQLGRMLGLAGIPLGQKFLFVDPDPECGARAVGQLIVADYDDEVSLAAMAEACEVVTYEFENVPARAAQLLHELVPLWPPPRALEVMQDRLSEKRLFEHLDLPTAAFVPADSARELATAVDEIGFPAVVKTRREGYDGKGQRVVRGTGDIAGLWEQLGSVPLLVEAFIEFERELSIIAVRSEDGSTAAYPLIENVHRDGILRLSRAPALASPESQADAEAIAFEIMSALGYVGVLTIELFDKDGILAANEMAPRVHNSGHWTIEGAETSQFENHIRAILGLPLGSTMPVGHSGMVNLIGEAPPAADILAVEGAHLHLYGKSPRPGRKLGHITIVADSADQLEQRLSKLDFCA